MPWPYVATPIAAGWTAMLTQLFLGWRYVRSFLPSPPPFLSPPLTKIPRIYWFTRNTYLYALIIALALPSCGLATTCGAWAWERARKG